MLTRVLGFGLIVIGLVAPQAQASPQKDLESAAKQEKIAFVLVTEPGATFIDQARSLVRDAMRQVKKATLVELNRSDPENARLVSRLRLGGAPVPLILVAARNGAIAGGVPARQATVAGLVAMVPSPKKAEALRALEGGKAVFIIAGRKGMDAEAGARAFCSDACAQLGGKSVMVQIDMDDAQEKAFLTQLKINLTSTEPVTVVVNREGQITASYSGAVKVTDLVQAATKRAAGCCPSSVQGGSKSCGPKS